MKVATHLKQGLDITVNEEIFWTKLHDAELHSEHQKTLLKGLWPITFIKSKAVLMCHSHITFKQMKAQQIIVLEVWGKKRNSKVKRWFRGPEFVWKQVATWQHKVAHNEVDQNDKEVKVIKVNSAKTESNILSTLESRISSWNRMKRIMGYVILFINKLKQKQCSKVQDVSLKKDLLDAEKIYNNEKMILELVQEGAFRPDIKSIKKSCLNENNQQHASLQKNPLQKLQPRVNENGIERVGGRFQNSFLDLEWIHPFILPKTGSTSTLIAGNNHNTVAHGDRSATMPDIDYPRDILGWCPAQSVLPHGEK